MTWGKFFFWSLALTFPSLFFIPKKRPGVVEPGPTTDSGDGDIIVTEPSNPPEPFPSDLREAVARRARGEIGSSDAAKYWASASPHVNMLGKDWCGAFALWTLHEEELATDWEWEPGLGFLMTKHHKLPMTKSPQVGDIAYFDKNQHEAVVVAVEPNLVHLINGNGAGGKVTASSVHPSSVTAFFSIEPLLQENNS